MGRIIATARCRDNKQLCEMGECLLKLATTGYLSRNASKIISLGKQILHEAGCSLTDQVILEACGWTAHDSNLCSPACNGGIRLPRSIEREALVILAAVFDNSSSLQEILPLLRKYQPLHISRPVPEMFYDEHQSEVNPLTDELDKDMMRSEQCLEYVIRTVLGDQTNKKSQRYYTKIWFDPENVLANLNCSPVVNNKPRDGDIVAYITTTRYKCRVSHWGVWDNGLVRSKWGAGDVFLHAVHAVPPSYGSRIRFFRRQN